MQLQNYPLYSLKFDVFDAGAAKRKIIDIKHSLDWLDADLTQARNEGKAIILNYHDSDQHWTDGYSSPTYEALKLRFANILKKYEVSAVFAGHYHERIRRSNPPIRENPAKDYGKDVYGSVPVFYSDSASQNKYLLVSFQSGQMTVEKVNSVSGATTRTVDGTYQLKMVVPSTPIAPAPQPGAITFFNQGGYVARYTLTYNSSG